MAVSALVSFKGGVSKTTSAIHLAALLGGENLLIDSDPNRSASTWSAPGKLPFKVCGELEAPRIMRSAQFDHIILDTPARPSEAEIAELARGCDLIIIPATPDALGLDAMALLLRTLPETANYRILLTMTPPYPQKDGEQALLALQEQKLPHFSRGIRYAKAYKDAAALGVTVNLIKGGKRVWRDWTEIKPEILKALG